jgi:hypothetical protein
MVQSLHADNDEEEGELQFEEREKLTWGIYQSSRGGIKILVENSQKSSRSRPSKDGRAFLTSLLNIIN